MADEQVLADIDARMKARAWRVVDAFMKAESENRLTTAWLATALHELATCWREEADAWTNSKKRGWQTTSAQLRNAASRLAGVAEDIKAVDVVSPELAEPAVQASATPASVDDNPLRDPAFIAEITQPNATPALVKEVQMQPTQPQPAGTDPFIDPPKPTFSGSTALGPKWTFEDLMAQPAHRPELTHWSWSQLETAEDCGFRYRFTKLDKLPQVPQWALIGGNTFHACIKDIETDSTFYHDMNTEKHWGKEFHRQIADVASSTTVPMDKWRASNRGAEGYTWWLTEGPDMLARYVDYMAGAQRELLYIDGRPVIEYETKLDVAGVEVQMVIDAAYHLPLTDSILVLDYKTGRSQPSSTGQLGLYAYGLLAAQGIAPATTPPQLLPKIVGRYYDARKGIESEPVDLLARHPFNEYAYRFHAAEKQRRTALYLPRPSSFCAGCSVRYACPVGGQ